MSPRTGPVISNRTAPIATRTGHLTSRPVRAVRRGSTATTAFTSQPRTMVASDAAAHAITTATTTTVVAVSSQPTGSKVPSVPRDPSAAMVSRSNVRANTAANAAPPTTSAEARVAVEIVAAATASASTDMAGEWRAPVGGEAQY